MADSDKKISDLDAADPLTVADEVVVVQSGTSKRGSGQQIVDLVESELVALTEGQVVFGGASGELKQSSNFLFNDATQSIQTGLATTVTGTRCAAFGTTFGTISGAPSRWRATTPDARVHRFRAPANTPSRTR